ncbi:hypothetical protein, partial [Gordonia sp. GAMMA]|uniref:hypothetical protein n=1 Tax=Gordonia sp. GAMMA TaxID=2502241 RepID=UPI001BB1ABFF
MSATPAGGMSVADSYVGMSGRRGAGVASDGVRSGAARSATVGRRAPVAVREPFVAERDVADGRSGAPVERGFARDPGAALVEEDCAADRFFSGDADGGSVAVPDEPAPLARRCVAARPEGRSASPLPAADLLGG